MFTFEEILSRLEEVVKPLSPELEGTVTHAVLQAVAKEVETLANELEAKLAALDKSKGIVTNATTD